MDNKIDLISKDLEFVKDSVQDTSARIRSLEISVHSFSNDFAEHVATDRQVGSEIAKIAKTLEKNTDSLIEHMRRTEINEMNINELKNISEKIDSRLRPIEHDIAGKNAILAMVMKMGGIIGGLIAVCSFLYDIFKR